MKHAVPFQKRQFLSVRFFGNRTKGGFLFFSAHFYGLEEEVQMAITIGCMNVFLRYDREVCLVRLV